MFIYIARHAWAGERGDPRWPDDSLRDLTPEGIERYAKVVKALAKRGFAPGRIATSRYTKKGNEKKDYTTWHTVEIWNQATVNWLASKPLPKGAKVFVQGEIRHDQYTDKDGVEKYATDIIAEQMQMLGGKGEGQQ